MHCVVLVGMLLGMMVTNVLAKEVVEVKIQGINGELKQNVELMLSILQQKNSPALNSARIKRLYQNSFDEIEQALRPFGYFKPDIRGNLSEVDGAWHIEYEIDLREPLKVTRLDFKIEGEAAQDKAFSKFTDELPLKEGQVLDQRLYKEAKQKLQSLAANRGYFKADFVKHKIQVNLAEYESDVTLHFDSGVRHKIGEIIIHAVLPSHELINKYLNFQVGDYYSVDALVDLQSALNDSDYFDSVEITALTNEINNDTIPVEINLNPRTKRRYSLGLGYGTDTGARARLGMNAPLVNSQGHHYDASILTSELKNAFSTRYRIPILNPRTDELAYNIAYNDEETTISKSESYTLGVGLTHARGAWRETLSLTYQEERFEVGEDSGRSTLFMPGVAWSRIWAKDRIYTKNGVSLAFDIRGASKFLVSDVDFVQTKAQAKLIHSFTPNGRFITRGTLGATFANEFATIPTSVRFFTGGDNSVRGYKYNSLGPEDSQGKVVGGRGLVVTSLEYEHNIVTNWATAIFYDVGNAVDVFDDPLKRGAGIGLRWKSPVGPMRIDLAFAVSEPGTPWRIHLNLGPDL